MTPLRARYLRHAANGHTEISTCITKYKSTSGSGSVTLSGTVLCGRAA